MKIKHLILCIMVLLLINIALVFSATEPEGPTSLTVANSSRRTTESVKTLQAYAGNVTQLNIVAYTVTQSWQGYYGNITGVIKLDDSTGNSFYDWQLANPQGEIYASESSINFVSDTIACWNYSRPSDPTYLEFDEYETGVSNGPAYSGMGINETDVDGVNETFLVNLTHQSFYVGNVYIDGSVAQGYDGSGSACPVVRLRNSSDETAPGLFEEVLLYDDSTDRPIFTSIIEEAGQVGFDGREWDFQMLVAEKGKAGDTETTEYYFYVELE